MWNRYPSVFPFPHFKFLRKDHAGHQNFWSMIISILIIYPGIYFYYSRLLSRFATNTEQYTFVPPRRAHVNCECMNVVFRPTDTRHYAGNIGWELHTSRLCDLDESQGDDTNERAQRSIILFSWKPKYLTFSLATQQLFFIFECSYF